VTEPIVLASGDEVEAVGAESDGSFYFEVFDHNPVWPAYFLESNGTRVRPPIDEEAMQTDFYFEDILEDCGRPPAVYDSLGHRVDVLSLIRFEPESEVQSYIEVFGDDPHRPISFEMLSPPSDPQCVAEDENSRSTSLADSLEEEDEEP
jgi:hypothetical protein